MSYGRNEDTLTLGSHEVRGNLRCHRLDPRDRPLLLYVYKDFSQRDCRQPAQTPSDNMSVLVQRTNTMIISASDILRTSIKNSDPAVAILTVTG